jgi:hypothetical protein
VTSTTLVLTLVSVSLALRHAGKAALVCCAESPLLTRVSKVTILLGDSLRSVGELVGDLVGSLGKVANTVGSALRRGRVLHVLVRKALGLGCNTTLGCLAESTLLAGVCEVSVLFCYGLRVGGHLGDDVLCLLLEVGSAVGSALESWV